MNRNDIFSVNLYALILWCYFYYDKTSSNKLSLQANNNMFRAMKSFIIFLQIMYYQDISIKIIKKIYFFQS